ncbi:MAG TPA: VWA domain-containing protein [Thermoanaerobaculia bacterium]|nr:VWA domain-containing protein [Thermoanaerobaculia bacterium]
MNRIIALLVAATLAAPMPAQQKQNAEPEMPKLVDVVDVRVINVDVVVTDRKGNFVSGLTKDDFEVLENGTPKTISNFYEVEGPRAKGLVAGEVGGKVEAPVAPAPVQSEEMKRRIIFYIDNLSLAPFNRNRVFSQMKEFIHTVMRPGDEAMVATYNRSMKVRVPFTRDAAQVESILDTIARESGMGIANRSERKQFEDRIRDARSYEDAVTSARTYASSVEHDLRNSVASLNALLGTLAGVEGKKILVLTSEGFPIQPGRELFLFIDEIAREKQWSGASTILEGMTYDGTSLVQSVAKTANANDITLYTIHAAGLTGGSEVSAENARPIPPMVSHAAAQNTIESMQMMADMTGGIASTNTNNFADAFKRIHRDLEAYYSIGYRAGTERVDRQRYLNVRTKNRDYRVRARQTFVEKSLHTEMGDRVIANLLYRVKDNDLGIIARVGAPVPVEDGLFRVAIDVQIPMTQLTMLPQGETEFAGGFDVYVVVGNRDNDMSDVARKSHQIRITADQMKTIQNKHYTYTLELLIEKGLNRISVGVADQISNTTGFAREQIIAQNR